MFATLQCELFAISIFLAMIVLYADALDGDFSIDNIAANADGHLAAAGAQTSEGWGAGH